MMGVTVAILLLVGSAHGASQRWWEDAGKTIVAFSPKCALGRGFGPGPTGQMRGLPAYLAMLDELYANNVTTLQLDPVYDSGSGYDPSFFFSGLAGSNFSAVTPLIGGDAEWQTFISAAHRRNMTVTSFWNAAYFWTGSPYVKQAEADIREYGLGNLPESSPARWFRWSSHKAQLVKPPDDKPTPAYTWDWVYDPDVNASYLSTWGNSPTADYASPYWRAEMRRILTHWITTMKLDGFFFDAPDAYIGAGNGGNGLWEYTPGLLREAITDVIRNVSGGRAAAWAEIYNDPPLMEAFGFDGGNGDGKLCPSHSSRTCAPSPRAQAIGDGVGTANATLLELAMSGPGSVDDMTAQVFQAPGVPFRSSFMFPPVEASWLPNTSVLRNGLDCSLGAGAQYSPPQLGEAIPLAQCFELCVADPKCEAVRVDYWGVLKNWTLRDIGCALRGGINPAKCNATPGSDSQNVRYSTFAVDAPSKAQLTIAVSLLAGYKTEPQHGWSVAPKPGDTGGKLPALLAAMQGEAALGLNSLRLRVPTASGSHYALLRYDALGSGHVALSSINLGASSSTVVLDLTALPPQLLKQQPRNLTNKATLPRLSQQYTVQVAARGCSVFSGLRLPKWSPRGYLMDCPAEYAPSSLGEMPLAQCLVACLKDAKCDAVMVEWVQRHSWGPQGGWWSNLVNCDVRGGVDLARCSHDASQTHSVLTVAQVEE